MTSELIERVARAMTRTNYSVFEWTEKQLVEMVDRDWHVSIPEAQAAIAAIQADAAPETSVKLRDAVEVWEDAYGSYMLNEVGQDYEAAAAIIEQDREAVRAEQAAEIERLREALEAYAARCTICSGGGSIVEEDSATGALLWRDCPGCTPARAALAGDSHDQ